MAVTRAKTSDLVDAAKYISFLAGNPAFTLSSFDSIATVLGTGSSGTVTFSSIPAGYASLQIRAVFKDTATASATTNGFSIQFNGSSTASQYVGHDLRGNGTSASASGYASGTYGSLFYSSAIPTSATAIANVTGVAVIDIHDYASTTRNKTVRTFYGVDANTASASYPVVLSSGLWISTEAITSIAIINTAGNWASSARFELYGVKG